MVSFIDEIRMITEQGKISKEEEDKKLSAWYYNHLIETTTEKIKRVSKYGYNVVFMSLEGWMTRDSPMPEYYVDAIQYFKDQGFTVEYKEWIGKGTFGHEYKNREITVIW